MRCKDALVDADYCDPASLAVLDADLGDQIKSRMAIAGQLGRYGFAVVRFNGTRPAHIALEYLADLLGLGEIFVPEIYRDPAKGSDYKRFAEIVPDDSSRHPGFANSNAQAMHVDGLLEPIATIKMSMLYCVSPALSGGQTIVFNSSGAFTGLQQQDPAAAAALLDKHVLERFTTIPGIHRKAIGPAFQREPDGEVVTRFSDGLTERWHARDGLRAELERALRFFRSVTECDNRFRVSVPLEPDQALILRNDQVSHGREAFVSHQGRPRHLVRALFLKAPSGALASRPEAGHG
jgi:alpha-ketoglutarate-dependent taurine dioxygenase